MTSSIKITLTNPDTVAFYNEYYTPEETDTNIRAIIDTHVTNLRKHIRASNDRLEDKEIMLHMHKLEQNMYENHASQLLNISTTIASSINASTDESKSFIADEFKLLSQNIDALNSTIQSQILSLINTVDTAVTNSLEKLDVNLFSETIGKTIQDHLSLEISRLVGC